MLRASVINPYQKFYALDGITPLSGGSVRIYQNLTTDLLAIYADSNLTVPQDNPYTLDAGGAITGDVYFNGLASIVSYDSEGAEIRTDDFVTCFDQSSPFAVWDPSVTYNDDGSSSNIVQSPVDDNYYISTADDNLNHEPSANVPTWWEPYFDYLIRIQGLVDAGYVAIGNNTTGLAGVNINAKGSLIAGNGTLPIALPVGTNGFALIADSGQASGLLWSPVTAITIVRAARTSNTILGVNDKSKLIDITSGTFTQTFDAAATLMSGWFVYIRNSGTGVITLDPNASETIDGASTLTLLPGVVIVPVLGSEIVPPSLEILPDGFESEPAL